MSSTIKVALATPLESGLRNLVTDVDPSVDLLVDDSLLPPQRFPGDHEGDPAFSRTHRQQAAFERLLSQADVFYGIPDTRPAALAPAVRANPGLRWVHTMAAGGGAQVKAAALTPAELRRVLFTTSAGVHGGPLAEFAIFGILAGAKDLARLQAQQAARQWTGRWAMKQVHEQTVLVVGLGGIGREVARLAKALGASFWEPSVSLSSSTASMKCTQSPRCPNWSDARTRSSSPFPGHWRQRGCTVRN
jgi:D-isomer specific 2-hydroxyacid dehydrogenase, NAD binding domain